MNLSNKDENANYLWEYYSNSNGLDFQFVEHSYSTSPLFGAGHCFPGPVNTPNSYSCKEQADYSWGEKVIDFFIEHPKK